MKQYAKTIGYFAGVIVAGFLLVVWRDYYVGGGPLGAVMLGFVLVYFGTAAGFFICKIDGTGKRAAIFGTTFFLFLLLQIPADGLLKRVYVAGFERRVFQAATPEQWRSLIPLAAGCLTSDFPDDTLLNRRLPSFARKVFLPGHAWASMDLEPAPDQKFRMTGVFIGSRGSETSLVIREDQAAEWKWSARKTYPTSARGIYIMAGGGD